VRLTCVVMSAIVLALLLPAASAAQQVDEITSRGLGGVHFCDPLRRVNDLFPTARDTVMTGEGGTRWHSKVVSLSNAEWIIFESSWVDTTHVWRVTTTGSKYHTPGGVRMGMSLEEVLRQEQKLEFSYPEGYVVITLVPDSVSFFVDDHSAAEFWAHAHYKTDSVDALKVMSHDARIKQLFAGGSCKYRLP